MAEVTQIARVKLTSTDYKKLEETSRTIKDVAEKFGASVTGPVPMPTKKLKVVCRKAVSGDGTPTIDHWQLRIHKRVLDIGLNERALRHIMRVEIPDGVTMELELKD